MAVITFQTYKLGLGLCTVVAMMRLYSLSVMVVLAAVCCGTSHGGRTVHCRKFINLETVCVQCGKLEWYNYMCVYSYVIIYSV